MTQTKSPEGVNHFAIALGLIAGLTLGLVAAATGSITLTNIATAFRPIGSVFVNAIRMVVIPLVMVVVFLAVGRLGDAKKLGKLGGYSLGLVWLSYVPAILLGAFGMRLGLRLFPIAPLPVPEAGDSPELPGIVDFLVGLIPDNPFEAAASGSLLPLLVFTVLFGAATIPIPPEAKKGLLDVAEAASDALVRMVHWILWTAPLGVFALAAPLTADAGWDMLGSLAVFVVTVIVCLVIQWVLIYLPAVRILGKMDPVTFHKATLGTSAIGFGTTSSLASLPVMLEEAEDNLKLSKEVYPLILSLLAPLNKAGSALFQAASVVFLAGLYDVPLPVAGMGALFIAVFLVALTVAPVPSAGVVTLAPALETVGVPLAGMGILLGIDRIPDMCRSCVNITGHMIWAVVVEELAIGRARGQGRQEGDI
ncbi:MAG: dicarboxylate/amino acid:cation symporter [Gemmatimonadetes bacterium]|nr:dicarboxylate/amino acid:cation symporter [Gemmatimonadota bacterium]NNM04170.1 dicarboxylate/amino acid:cation symporter [Gemmatimonadota bacterium]